MSEFISTLPPNGVYVFGSNERGTHGKGAALYAKKHFGAVQGVAEGRTGRCYAIPTKSTPWTPLPLSRIVAYVNNFLTYAERNPDLEFYVTRVGCGLGGKTDAEMAPLFKRALSLPHVHLPSEWVAVLTGQP